MTTNLKIVDLPWTGSLYEPSSDALHDKILAELDKADASNIILFRTKADCHDYSNSWLTYLRDESTWQDLVKRLTRWHLLLAKIVTSEVKCFIVSSGDLIGSWWELALAMNGRILTNPYSKVGFPETYIDLFPPLGLLNMKRFRAYDGPANLRINAILHAKDAYKLGVVELCLLSDDWADDDGAKILHKWCEVHRSINDIKFNFYDYVSSIPTLKATEETRSVAKYRREWLLAAQIEGGFQIARARKSESRAVKLSELRAASAMRYLMAEYASWLTRRIVRYRLGLHDRWWTGVNDHITIDISFGLPPHEIVKTLLVRRKKIAFVARSAEKLRLGLESMRSRFDRSQLEGRDAYEMWGQTVTWHCSDGKILKGIWCQFNLDDTMDICFGNVSKKYLRMSGNHSAAGKGWYEDLKSDNNIGAVPTNAVDEIIEVVELMANGILKPKRQFHVQEFCSKSTSVTVAIRLVFFEYMLRICENIPKAKSITDCIKLLGPAGWGYAADVYNWENIIKIAEFNLPNLIDLKEYLFGAKSEWQLLKMESLANHKIGASSERKTSSEIRSGAVLTRMIESLASQLVHWLQRHDYTNSLDEADLLVTIAMGYPGHLSLPHSLGNIFGEDRIDYWLSTTGLEKKTY